MAQRRIFSSTRETSLPSAGSLWVASGLVALACALLLGGSYLLATLGRLMVVQDSPSRADAIVVISGDWGARLEQGVDLFQNGYAPVLVLVGGGQEGRPSAAQVMMDEAIKMGVPASAVLLVEGSASTREDAMFTRELMVQEEMKSAILVTSPYHQLRASLTFTRAFEGSGVALANYPVQEDVWRADNWWKTGNTLRMTLLELTKLAYYKLSGYL